MVSFLKKYINKNYFKELIKMTTEKLTGDMISFGTSFVKTIELQSFVYGKAPEYKIAIDIKPINRKHMKNIFQKYGIKGDQKDMDMSKADDMMTEICQLGIVDQAIVAKLDDMLEFLPSKIGSEILGLSTGTGIDLENFSKAKQG
jgi:hypothetical protein